MPGIFATIAALTLIDFVKPDYRLLERFDWLGLLSMAGFLGALEYVLEEGPRSDWFGEDGVLLLAWVFGDSTIIFFARVLMAKSLIVDLRAFQNRNFALDSLYSFVLGIGLYGLTYLYPLYLAEIPMAFADIFFLLALLFVALARLAVIIKRTPGLGAA